MRLGTPTSTTSTTPKARRSRSSARRSTRSRPTSAKRLAEIDAAEERLAAGTYGVCVVGGEPIDPARLDARPTATTCLAHAS